jgi:hypothetical protein
MSTQLHVLTSIAGQERAKETPQIPLPIECAPRDLGSFAEEQLRRLVRQVFFPGWPKPARHAAFVGIESDTDVAAICLQVGQILATEIQGNTCVVETDPHATGTYSFEAKDGSRNRNRARQVSNRLWWMPHAVFLEGSAPGISPVWLESRLEKFHADFDFTLLHLPAAARSSEAVLLGHLSDGVVLVVEANSTRRAKALATKEMLQAANVRILGTVLNGRRFPIPEGIYRRL